MTRVVHVPMALSTQGSTLMSVAQSLIDASARRGIDSAAVLSHNRDVSLDGADLAYVDYTRRSPRQWFTRQELAVDIAAGGLGALRPYYGRLYDPAVESAEGLDGDVVLLYEGHYASASLPRWRRVRDRAKVVLYVHNPLSRTYGRRELRRLLDSADAVAFCADHLRRDVVRRLGADSTRLSTVHNGVDPVFAPAHGAGVVDGADGIGGADGAPFTVVFAGRTSEHKGPHLVVEAVGRAARALDIPLRLEIIGSDSYGYEPAALTAYERGLREAATGMDAEVEFFPFVPKAQLADHLRRAAVVCLPSQWAEGLPLVALEAMASGAAVVTSDSAGMREAVGDAGLIVEGGAAEGLAEQIVLLASDPESLAAARTRSLARAGMFSWDAAASRLAALSGGA